jgi:hypothetical protein
LVARLENLAGDLSPRADKEGERAAQAGAEAAKAVARTGQAFEHTGRIESLKARLVAIDAELTKADEVPQGAPVRAGAPATGIGALMDATYPAGPVTVVRAPGPSEYRPVTVPDLEQPAQFER